MIRVGGGSCSFGLLLVVAASGFFLSADFSSTTTADLRVARTVGSSLGFSSGTLGDSAAAGETSGSDLMVTIFGMGNPMVFWNLSGTFRMRDDRGEGGTTFDSEGVVGADELSLLLVSFRSGVGTGFVGFGLMLGEGREGTDDGSFDRTTAHRLPSLYGLSSEVSLSFGC